MCHDLHTFHNWTCRGLSTDRRFSFNKVCFICFNFRELSLTLSLISLICDNSVTTQNVSFFRRDFLKVLKCYNFLWVQRRHNCSPAASFVNCVMTLYLLKVHLHTFLSILITQKCQILSCETLVANERYTDFFPLDLYNQWKLVRIVQLNLTSHYRRCTLK